MNIEAGWYICISTSVYRGYFQQPSLLCACATLCCVHLSWTEIYRAVKSTPAFPRRLGWTLLSSDFFLLFTDFVALMSFASISNNPSFVVSGMLSHTPACFQPMLRCDETGMRLDSNMGFSRNAPLASHVPDHHSKPDITPSERVRRPSWTRRL